MNDERFKDILASLRARRDSVYLIHSDACREGACLGHEIKILLGKFQAPELAAHQKAAELRGRYFALVEVIDLLAELEEQA